MTDFIILIMILVLITLGVRSGVKHFKGEGGCCGGGSSVKSKKKKLKAVIATRVVDVNGMTCEHCKNRVQRCIDDMDGAAVKVNLKKKEVVVSLAKAISDEEICKAIEKAGYEVVSIHSILK